MEVSDNKKGFKLRVGEFDGPFDLLLDLIKQKKVAISDVSLAEISGKYITFVKENEFKLLDATSFLLVAATLMLIKSRSLLPRIIFEKEDEEEIDDLKMRLNILNEFKKVSLKIANLFGKNILYKKRIMKNREVKFLPDDSLNIDNFLKSIDSLVSSIKIKEKAPEKKVQKQMSLKEITDRIYHKIVKYFKVDFDEIVVSGGKKEKAASFLAILELFRNGKINLFQSHNFGKIKIEKTDPGLIYKE